MKKLNYICWAMLLISMASFAKFNANYPGGVVSKQVPCSAKAYFNNARVMILSSKKHCLAIVGIPLTSKLGKHDLIVNLFFFQIILFF